MEGKFAEIFCQSNVIKNVVKNVILFMHSN